MSQNGVPLLEVERLGLCRGGRDFLRGVSRGCITDRSMARSD